MESTLLWCGLGAAASLAFVGLVWWHRKKIQNWTFAVGYSKFVAPRLLRLTAPCKEELFASLKGMSCVGGEKCPPRILEIGPGPGQNFQYYPEGCKLTVVDKNPDFMEYFLKNKSEFGHVELVRCVNGLAEDMSEIPDSSVDVVVGTYLLCSVTDIEKVLKEIRRVLVPGGRYMYMEHVSYPEDSWHRVVQKVVEPLWRPFTNGCYLTRNPSATIETAGFGKVDHKYFNLDSLDHVLRPTLMGVATK